MISLIQKGILASLNPYYFVLVLGLRSVSSALYRAILLGLSVKRNIRYKKIILNLSTNGIPSIIMFLIITNRVPFLEHVFGHIDIESDSFIRNFVIYMTVNRITRTILQIRKQRRKKLLKKQKKEQKLKNEKEQKKETEMTRKNLEQIQLTLTDETV
eukprot:CAMPEP_0170543832 /NCGR_PEP_ID=MMETSP0211-20121228/2812_1 /TAXON_ID=311385 /ORGANISM="Pseudokeronopsis sp., Strain OXSARD2" /LENGTH=156 /DNA_ID=CAMNT_0010847313 /DNA_START=515 /DNA_END=985 /DNA_ORIENTATION=+